MGIRAAETMMDIGISKKAFQHYVDGFSEVIEDLPYARTVRRFVIWGAKYGYLAPVIQMAKYNQKLKKALFDSVSGKRAYRRILLDTISIKLLFKMTAAMIYWFMKRVSDQ